MYKSEVYVNSKLFNILLGEKKNVQDECQSIYKVKTIQDIVSKKKKNSFKINV